MVLNEVEGAPGLPEFLWEADEAVQVQQGQPMVLLDRLTVQPAKVEVEEEEEEVAEEVEEVARLLLSHHLRHRLLSRLLQYNLAVDEVAEGVQGVEEEEEGLEVHLVAGVVVVNS